MVQKLGKGANGTGDTLTVYFDPTDGAERRALEAARLLAEKHGRRKQAVIALLEAIYREYEQTGELLTAQEISTRITGKGQQSMLAASTAYPTSVAAKRTPVEVTEGGKASAQEVAMNFLTSAGKAFFD